MTQVGKSGGQCDRKNLVIAASQGLHAGFDAPLGQVVDHGDADVLFERPAQVSFAQPDAASQAVQRHGFGMLFVELPAELWNPGGNAVGLGQHRFDAVVKGCAATRDDEDLTQCRNQFRGTGPRLLALATNGFDAVHHRLRRIELEMDAAVEGVPEACMRRKEHVLNVAQGQGHERQRVGRRAQEDVVDLHALVVGNNTVLLAWPGYSNAAPVRFVGHAVDNVSALSTDHEGDEQHIYCMQVDLWIVIVRVVFHGNAM